MALSIENLVCVFQTIGQLEEMVYEKRKMVSLLLYAVPGFFPVNDGYSMVILSMGMEKAFSQKKK